ncbi:hypothetical protein V1VFAS_001 [Rhizobium phage V1VFA-S]|nr:hypothetical protein V1VFAS_001 [Rhizobium phage V1VFA-S]
MSTNYKTAADRITESLKGADELDNWHKHGEGYNDLRRDMTKLRDDLAASYDNPGTVVVPLVEVNGGLLLVRRKLADGYGKLALPGGFQAIGETWEEAGVREVYEETGAPDPKEIAFPTHAEQIQSWFEALFPADTQD